MGRNRFLGRNGAKNKILLYKSCHVSMKMQLPDPQVLDLQLLHGKRRRKIERKRRKLRKKLEIQKLARAA